MKHTIIVCALMTIMGCETTREIVDRGADVNDATLQTARFAQCRAASIGSIGREFNTQTECEGWNHLCHDPAQNTVKLDCTGLPD